MNFLVLFFMTLLFSCGKSPFASKEGQVKSLKAQSYEEFESFINFDDVESKNLALTNQTYKVSGYWQVGPFLSKESKLLIMINDEQGKRTDLPFEFKALLWMPDMGHGSFPIKVSHPFEGGVELTDLFFTMKGHWDIHIELKVKNKVIKKITWPIVF